MQSSASTCCIFVCVQRDFWSSLLPFLKTSTKFEFKVNLFDKWKKVLCVLLVCANCADSNCFERFFLFMARRERERERAATIWVTLHSALDSLYRANSWTGEWWTVGCCELKASIKPKEDRFEWEKNDKKRKERYILNNLNESFSRIK